MVDDGELLLMQRVRTGAQQSSTTDDVEASSARLRTDEEMHWSVKIPAQMTFLMPRLCRIRRRFVPVKALVGGLGDGDLVALGCQFGDELRGMLALRSSSVPSPASSD